MPTYTSSLPKNLLEKLSDMATQLKVPKNKLIEKSLSHYLEYLDRKMYIQTFKELSGDTEMLEMAEEGITDFYDMIQKSENE